MSLIKTLVLRLSPKLARIINTSNQMSSENALLKVRIAELEKLIDGTSTVDKTTTPSPPGFLKDRVEDFSVMVFDRKVIPGKKNES